MRGTSRHLRRGASPRWVGALLFVLPLLLPGALQGQKTITDIRGRTVTLPSAAPRILIDDGRYLLALSLLAPDPVAPVVGWPRDVHRLGETIYGDLRARFPAIERIPQVSSSAGVFSLEAALSVAPNVAIFTEGMGPTERELQQLERAGVATVFVDFFTNPFRNLEESLRILGAIVGEEAEAEAFVAFRRERMARISGALATVPESAMPAVFFEAHAGITDDCCNSPGLRGIGDYISFARGRNIAGSVIPGQSGRLNLEYVISQRPEVYILSGGPHLERPGGLVVGPGYPASQARASLRKMLDRPGLSLLPAVTSGRVHGLSHQLLNSPIDILAVEAIARWLHPAQLQELDPSETLDLLNERFLAVALRGDHWVDLGPGR